MENSDDATVRFDEKVGLIFQEKPRPMPKLPKKDGAAGEILELDSGELDAIQAAGDAAMLYLRRFFEKGEV